MLNVQESTSLQKINIHSSIATVWNGLERLEGLESKRIALYRPLPGLSESY
jgi:hypothetical protein